MKGDRAQARRLVAPAVAALLVVAAYPMVSTVWLSFQQVLPFFGERRFTGLENWAFLVRDGRFWSALGHTLYFAAAAVAIELPLGVALALLLDRPGRGRGLLRAAVLVPWAVPTVVSAKAWAWLFHPELGVLPKLLGAGEAGWLGTPGAAMRAAIAVDVWKTTPFVALLVLAGLQGIPRGVLEAARVDGASEWRTFRSVTLPLLWPALGVTLLFRALDALRVFDAVYVLTEGGPANTTETLSIYAYKTLMRAGDFGYGATLSVATFAVVGGLAAMYLRATRSALEEGR